MTFGRIATFALILAVSIAVAGVLVHRHRERPDWFADVFPPPPPTSSVRVPVARRSPPPKKGAAVVAPGPSSASARPPSDVSAAPSEDPLSDALCPDGMLLMDGTTCAEGTRLCAEPDPKAPSGCRRYDAAVCRKGLSIRACIDRYEYPNLEGMLPATLITFEQARGACSEEGKRLCTETEWSFACEGPAGLAFSYGDAREDGACNDGRTVPEVRAESLWEARDIGAVLERVDARAPSGSTARCTSSFGVHDLVGNVEEWVKSDIPGFEAALRGGEYSSEPSCRTVRQIRQAGFRQFDTGFRCCRDPLVRAARRRGEDADEDESRQFGRTVAPPHGFD